MLYCRHVRWERFFEDLEDQLDSEWEAERAALDSEAERLRLSRIALRERMLTLIGGHDAVQLELADGASVTGSVMRVGADWLAVSETPGSHGALVPLAALVTVRVDDQALLSSARSAHAGPPSAQRMSFGFVLRELVRRRQEVSIRLRDGRVVTGTIDRAGADHLDLALHDLGVPRSAGHVTGFRLIPFTAIAAVRSLGPA